MSTLKEQRAMRKIRQTFEKLVRLLDASGISDAALKRWEISAPEGAPRAFYTRLVGEMDDRFDFRVDTSGDEDMNYVYKKTFHDPVAARSEFIAEYSLGLMKAWKPAFEQIESLHGVGVIDDTALDFAKKEADFLLDTLGIINARHTALVDHHDFRDPVTGSTVTIEDFLDAVKSIPSFYELAAESDDGAEVDDEGPLLDSLTHPDAYDSYFGSSASVNDDDSDSSES